MKRRKKIVVKSSAPGNQPKSRIRQGLENQLVGRSSKLMGNALVARGAFLQSNQAISYTKLNFILQDTTFKERESLELTHSAHS